MNTEATHPSDSATLMRMARQTKPWWVSLAMILALSALSTPIALLSPVPMMIAVDSVIGDKAPPALLSAIVPASATASPGALLLLVALMVVGIALLSQLHNISLNLLRTYAGERITLAFQSELLNHSQRLSLAYHDTRGTSDTLYRVQYDAPALARVFIHSIPGFLTATFTVAGMIVVTASIDWTLALVALTVAPVLLVTTQVFRGRLRSVWRDVKNKETRAFSVIQESLSTLRIVKAFGQEEREHDRFVSESTLGVKARLRVAHLDNVFALVTSLTVATGTAAVLYFGVTHVRAGTLTLGQLLLIMSYLAQLYQPLKAIGQQITKAQAGLASVERAYALRDELPEVVEKANALPLTKARGDIEFDHVSFAYETGSPVLEDISFSIPAGARVGIIGRTGAGKSTLINLMLRLYDPQSGVIRLDGNNIMDYRLSDLRDQFSMVLQETILLSTTIAENIAYGRPDASREDIIAAARFANVDDFISRLPEGYETQVGERGMRLSGGQRQRISIARAFLKNAPVLILDEPTSSVDTTTEASIIAAINRLMAGRTTLMIAHRVSTLSECDLILELDAGRLRDVRSRVLAAESA